MRSKITRTEFIKKATNIHGQKYNYDLVLFNGANDKIIIKCNICNKLFTQRLSSHIEKNHPKGCPHCAIKLLSNIRLKNARDKFNKNICILQPEIDFSKDTYKGWNYPYKCICKKCSHIWFATPNNLTNRKGCPKCKSSKGEKEIERWLKERNINFIPQYRFKDCRNKKPLPFDFYLTELNICIEYDGEQHFRPMGFGGNAQEKFQRTKINDKIKNQFCKQKRIKLLRISFNENINHRLSYLETYSSNHLN